MVNFEELRALAESTTIAAEAKFKHLCWSNRDAILTALSAAEKLEVAKEALEPFAAVDLTGHGLPEGFALHVLKARQALAALEPKP